MSQFDFGNLSSPLSGAALIDSNLEPWRNALHTSHSGASRPSYVQAGMIWIDTTTNPWILKLYDGASDVTLGTVNTTTHVFTPASTDARWCGTAGGTANALTLTPTTARTAYTAGDVFEFIIGTTNTSETVTVNVSALGTKNIKAFLGAGKVAIPIAALPAGQVARCVYDGTDVVLLNVRPDNQFTAVASATTTNLDTATGNIGHITGTTAITGITLTQGRHVTVVFDGALVLTNGASLINITGANITTAAGDIAEFVGEASGVVRMTSYTRADGSPVKRVRVNTIASSATPTPNGDTTDNFTVTAQAAAAAFAAPTGTPVDGQRLTIRIKDNGTARALTWNAIYRAGTDVALPTTTVISKTMYVGFMYNSADSKWDLVSSMGNI